MNKYVKALRQGQEQRKKAMELQGKILALFVNHIEKIDDVTKLETIKKELQG